MPSKENLLRNGGRETAFDKDMAVQVETVKRKWVSMNVCYSTVKIAEGNELLEHERDPMSLFDSISIARRREILSMCMAVVNRVQAKR